MNPHHDLLSTMAHEETLSGCLVNPKVEPLQQIRG
jgi:hypothetical protein